MFIDVILKCPYENAPYRVYINDELITERFYTFIGKNEYVHPLISNTIHVELKDSLTYDVRVESLTDKQVLLSDYTVREKKNEN